MFGWSLTNHDVDLLIARKRYDKAIRSLRKYLAEDPENIRIRQRLADALALNGETAEAVQILYPIVDEFVDSGFVAKAIAVLKKIQRIEPGHDVVESRLAALVRRRTEGTQEVPAAATAPSVPVAPPDPEEPELVRLHEEHHGEDELEGIRRSALFGQFSEAELLALIRGFHLVTFEPGEIIVTEGQPGDSLFILASGTVRVYVTNPMGRSEQVRTLNQGEFFGEISLLSGQPRTATITCVTTCELLELDRRNLNDIAATNPEVPHIIESFYQQRVNSPEELEVRTSIEIPL
jgi:cAMP-dependent protein kinase regulator